MTLRSERRRCGADAAGQGVCKAHAAGQDIASQSDAAPVRGVLAMPAGAAPGVPLMVTRPSLHYQAIRLSGLPRRPS